MKTLFLVMLLLFGTVSRASAEGEGFYTVQEIPKKNVSESSWGDPLQVAETFWSQSEILQEVTSQMYSLLSFLYHQEKFGDVTEPYSRQKHFGSWVNDRRDNECYNTRAKVLIRDSEVPVQFRETGCTVAAGQWQDPYGGRVYTQAADMQIDHFVPLKNAYISGAYKWNRPKRCLYANFLGNEYHLLAVFGRENNSKGDKTPEGYLPSDESYQCQYLNQWLKVKLVWALALTPSEKEKVMELIQNNHCDLREMVMTDRDLKAQRQFISDNMDLCTR